MTAELRAPAVGGGPGPPGPPGPPGGVEFTFTQDVASALWLIGHMLGAFPNVAVADTLGREVDADVTYIDDNNITVAFANPATGVAYLS
jgi:hypothetical protein